MDRELRSGLRQDEGMRVQWWAIQRLPEVKAKDLRTGVARRLKAYGELDTERNEV